MRLRNRQRLRLPGRLQEEEEEGYFEDDGQGNEDEENQIPESSLEKNVFQKFLSNNRL